MKSIVKQFAAFVSAAVMALTGCTDLSDLENRVDTLESKVVALETFISGLNSNVEAIQTLMEGGSLINSVNEKDGVYTIVLSNGDEITLTQGAVGVGTTPVVSIDKDGYWMVDYGQGPEYIYADDQKTEKIKAFGTDGVTPVFGVDAEGYWTVSYDGGKTFQQVKDASGAPVSAVAGEEMADMYFKDVKYENGVFSVTLQSGETLTIPVVESFMFKLNGADEAQSFTEGQTRSFALEHKGVVNVMVTVPEGWKWALSETEFSLTAPAATKGIVADSDSDVSLLAVSASGYSAIVKMCVKIGEGSGETPGEDPVVPEDPKPQVTDLYQAYLDGEMIEIAGLKYSKATHGEPVLVSATETSSNTLRTPINKKTGVFFLETAEGADFTFTSNITFNKTAEGEDMVLIGRYLDREQVIKPASFFKAVSGGLVLHNLVIDFATLPQNYLIVNNCTEDQSKLHIDGCTFRNVKYHMYSIANSNYYKFIIKDVCVTNSVFDFTDNEKILFNFSASTVADHLERFSFTNNILCASDNQGTRTCQIVQFGTADHSGKTWNTTYDISNNIIYNVLSVPNTYFKIHQAKSIKMNRNILWAPADHGSMCYMWYLMNDGQDAAGVDFSDNIAYGMVEGKSWSAFSGSSAFRFESGNAFEKTEVDPFEKVDLSTYTFVKKSEYQSYGVQQ